MLQLLFLSLLVIAFVATVVIWRRDRRRAAEARILPEEASPHRVKAERDLVSSLLDFARRHPSLETRAEHGNLLVKWRLGPVPEGTTDLPTHAHSVELQFDEAQHTVHARHGRGTIEWWPHDEDRSTLWPTVEWIWDMEPDFVPPGPPELGAEPAIDDAPERHPHTAEGLVRPLRERVLAAGWVWQPVLELPVTDRVAERIEDARAKDRRSPAEAEKEIR